VWEELFEEGLSHFIDPRGRKQNGSACLGGTLQFGFRGAVAAGGPRGFARLGGKKHSRNEVKNKNEGPRQEAEEELSSKTKSSIHEMGKGRVVESLKTLTGVGVW